MTRLLFLAACFTSALATMDSSYGSGSYGGGSSGSGSSGSGNMMSADSSNKNAAGMSSGSSAATVDISITIISSYAGGNAPVKQISQPSMAQGMMHKVSLKL